jgi:hypothetical protein
MQIVLCRDIAPYEAKPAQGVGCPGTLFFAETARDMDLQPTQMDWMAVACK